MACLTSHGKSRSFDDFAGHVSVFYSFFKRLRKKEILNSTVYMLVSHDVNTSLGDLNHI